MAQARITRGEQVVEVSGISSAAAYALAKQAIEKVELAAGDEALIERDPDAKPFGFTLGSESGESR